MTELVLQVETGLAFSSAIDIVVANFGWIILGVLIGMFLGIIPGMGGVVTLTILLPFTLGMETFQAFCFLTGAFGATTMSGSITAILINTPGTGSNAATLIDGYPLTKQGRGATAIAASAFASGTGAIVGVAIFIISLPVLFEFVLLFGPSEIFWLIISALVIIPMVVGEKFILGILGAGLGSLLALIGRAPPTGQIRFTFGQLSLQDGIPLIPALIGIFALAEIIHIVASKQTKIVTDDIELSGTRVDGIKSVIEHKWLWLRSSVIGVVIGAVPGAGGSAASFIAYGQAVSTSKDPSTFGEGRIEGVIASEAANDSKDGGQLFPTLGLGIPGSGTMAVFIAGLLLHGVSPGPRLILDHTDLVLVVSLALVISNVSTSIIALLATNVATKVVNIPVYKLLPVVTVLALAATLLARNNPFDLLLAFVFTLIGLVFIYNNISRVPFIIAFILFQLAENNLHLAIRYERGDYISALFTGPVNILLIVIIFITILGTFIDFKSVWNRVIGS